MLGKGEKNLFLWKWTRSSVAIYSHAVGVLGSGPQTVTKQHHKHTKCMKETSGKLRENPSKSQRVCLLLVNLKKKKSLFLPTIVRPTLSWLQTARRTLKEALVWGTEQELQIAFVTFTSFSHACDSNWWVTGSVSHCSPYCGEIFDNSNFRKKGCFVAHRLRRAHHGG